MSSKEEFEAAYRQYSDKIFRYLFWHTRDSYLAEDLTSEVFLRAWQSWQRFDGIYPQAWLYRIAHNLLLDTWRKHKTVSLEEVEEPAYDENLVERLAQDFQVQEVARALDKLPPSLKTVVILRCMEGHSAKEVAAIVGTSPGNVRVMQHRALQQLREVLSHGKH